MPPHESGGCEYREGGGGGTRDWAEQQWESYLKREELRAAKYEEIRETLGEREDFDELVWREMCFWPGYLGEEEPEDAEGGPHGERLSQDHQTSSCGKCELEMRRIEAYRRGMSLSRRIRKYVARACTPDQERHGLLTEAATYAELASMKVAAGHQIGYERDTLFGNIASCKLGLKEMLTSLDWLREVRRRGLVSKRIMDVLVEDAKRVRREIIRRIHELRERVWW